MYAILDKANIAVSENMGKAQYCLFHELSRPIDLYLHVW